MTQPLRPLALLTGLLLASLPALAGAAGATAETPHVKAELLASAGAVHPGETIRLGLRQRIIPHWHTYWINPGDSGLPTQIAWTLPDGARADPIEWPAPSRFATGPVSNYGYADEVTLLVPVHVPANLAPGARFPVKATVDWLVCSEVCVPEQVELSLDLPVVAAGAARPPGSAEIEQVRAALPAPAPGRIRIDAGTHALRLAIDSPALAALNPVEAWFYAAEWGKTHHAAPQQLRLDGNRLELRAQAGEAPPASGDRLAGILSLTDAQGRRHDFALAATVEAAPPGGSLDAAPPAAVPAAAADPGAAPEEGLQLGAALLLALLGGLVLNLMPCVFPVLSIKALALLRHAHQAPRETRLQGLAYAAGVLASFTLLAGVLLALKAGGSEVGWGFQFQSPVFVLGVAYLMFAVGLSLSGLITFGASAAGVGAGLADKPGYTGSFFTGVLASVVATPCTAPFMGAALGFALTQPAPVLLAVFLSLGLGLALPYLALSFWPALQRLLPRPGPWMERLKEGLAFPMYGAAVWLVWVLAQQAGPNAIALALGGMLAIAFAAWLAGHSRTAGPLARHGGRGLAALAVLGALAGGYLGVRGEPVRAATALSAGQVWEPYSRARFDALRAEGKPVFVNFTAAWCITCLANEKVALSDARVEAAFQQAGITYLKGDWTNKDPEISAHLARFGRSGVPLYLLYPAGKGDTAPQVLPQLLTPATVLAAVDGATVRALSLSSPSLSLVQE